MEIEQELTRSEREILVCLLRTGNAPPGQISDYTGRHSKTISKRLNRLSEVGLVENTGYGTWRPTCDGIRYARAVIEYRSQLTDSNNDESLGDQSG